MTIEEAASALRQTFGVLHASWLACIGVGFSEGSPTIFVYAAKKRRPKVPDEFGGYKVKVVYSGPMRVGRQGKGE